jgi:23S rRNA (cytidine1920-2'-O)/16S rRNA (cytidine1409-2'-O)-methyltransferase
MVNTVKQRIDQALVEQGYFTSREEAKRSIMAGEVYVNGKRIEKGSQLVGEPLEIRITSVGQAFVSRGGHKLHKALQVFNIPVSGKICLDAGASTGGFTDCLLREGARHVYAVDVGYGQLAWKLRQDPRVTVFERQNIRYFSLENLEDIPGLITADLSFISLELVLPKLKELIQPSGDLVALIKPQFEAGRGKVGKKGVVKDQSTHQEVLERLVKNSLNSGWYLVNLTFSPLLGPEGNIEFLGHWRLNDATTSINPGQIVEEAWRELKEIKA